MEEEIDSFGVGKLLVVALSMTKPERILALKEVLLQNINKHLQLFLIIIVVYNLLTNCM
jgi:hypothetical protein